MATGHPQNTPRGLIAKQQVQIVKDGSLSFVKANGTTLVQLTCDSTGVKIGSRYVSTNTTSNAVT